MIIAPVHNPDTGMWDILHITVDGGKYPLPGGMRISSSHRQLANEKLYTAAEQLGSLGFDVRPQEAPDER